LVAIGFYFNHGWTFVIRVNPCPMLLVLWIGVLLITYVPALTTFLPGLVE